MHHKPRPLGKVKDAAYAWRQMLFFLSRASHAEREAFPAYAEDRLASQPGHVRERLVPAYAGLRHVLSGGTFDPERHADSGRPFTGWSVERHWMLEAKEAPTG